MPGTATTILIDGTPTNGSDAWIDSLIGGGAWKDSDGGTVTIQWTSFQGTMDGQNSYSWTSLALAGLREALSLWESVANIDFVEVSAAANADVKFWWGTEAQAGGPAVLGWSDLPGFEDYYENPGSETRDILFNAQDPSMSGALAKGGLGLVTMVHEIGHLLGLAHPHDGGAGGDASLFPGVDGWNPYDIGNGGLNQGVYTTMSYNFGYASAYTGEADGAFGLQYGPMALDIAAIQAIYGANTNYAAGNDVYKLPAASVIGSYFSSIWDTGGIDTISNEGLSNDAVIDLRAAAAGINGGGNLSFATDLYGRVVSGGYTIARGVIVENAIGGNGDDTLTGNAAVNRLQGGSGNDILDGGTGADTMIGGAGQDRYHVDDIGDVIVELDEWGSDTVYSSVGFQLAATLENLILTGTGAANATGNSLANTLTGNAGDNVIVSGGGVDMIDGGAGNDRIVVSDFSFQWARGGDGVDALVVDGAGFALRVPDYSSNSKTEGFERFDLTGTGDNTLWVSQSAVLFSGEAVGLKRVVVVERDQGDQVAFSDTGWTKSGTITNADGTFDRWVFGNAEVHIEQVEAVAPPPSTVLLSSLNGSTGFRLAGVALEDYSGLSVASAGDVNGDGFDDVIVGAVGADAGLPQPGASYVVFGKESGFAASITLSSLNGSNGFKLSGVGTYDNSGHSVATAGDINGDGFADLVVSARWAEPNGPSSGASYVMFGKASGFASDINLATLNGRNGFKLSGAAEYDYSGSSVASAGDFNGDGYDDLIIGARGAGRLDYAGASYIIYGKASGFAANLKLSGLTAATGVTLNGAAAGEQSGYSVASAGDVNGDGFHDVIVGAKTAGPSAAGASYVVFGKASGTASIDLSSLSGSNGFRLGGVAGDYSGQSVASAGDVNGDGYGDLIVGAAGSDANGRWSGASYVVFGKASGFAANLDLSTLNGSNGFKLIGATTGSAAGRAVASAGDFNGDGFADLIVGAHGAYSTNPYAGASYVVFGTASGFAANIDLSTLDGRDGFALWGASMNDHSGASVASAGDVNGDGYDDVIIGASGADPNGASSGATYVVFGGAFGASGVPIATAGTAAAEILMGGRGGDELAGGGGGDVFHAGAGNDRLTVKDLSFRLADGGTGIDTLVLGGADLSLDLSKPLVAAKLDGIERVDLGSAGNTLIVSQLSILSGVGATQNGRHILVVERNLGDRVQFVEPGWTKSGSFTGTDGTFDRWVLGNAEVHIEQDSGVTIVGTAGNDVISTTVTVPGQSLATPLDDIIDGRAGADTMAGGHGDDAYIVDNAGDGAVELAGGGIDKVFSSIDWTLGANIENLVLTGSAHIQGTGNALVNLMTGNAGNNRLDGGAGADTMAAGLGDDIYVVDAAGDVVTEGVGEGTDTVSASIGWVLGANVENLVLTGIGDLNGSGNALANVLTGNAGKNVLDGGLGADTMTGGAGNDSYVVDNAGDVVTELADGGIDTVLASADWTLGANVEKLTLTGTASIDGTGNALANVLTGNGGKNVLDGGAGADAMAGGAGDDSYVVDNTGDVLTELTGGGSDTVLASVNWTLGANLERLTLTGIAHLAANGNELANMLTGNAGSNVLDGKAGADKMAGGLGDDTYVVDTAGDVVTEVADQGTDTVNAWVGWTLGANLEQLRLLGAADLIGTGNGLNNALYGNAGKNLLDGKAGADTMAGGLGDDTYIIDNSGDQTIEVRGAGVDLVRSSITWTLATHVEDLTLTGIASINGTGNGSNNVLTGNSGNNVLDGGAGADSMAGGLGNDTYVVDNALDVVTELEGGGVDTVLSSVGWTLGAHVERLTLTGTADRSGTGNELANTLTGNSGRNLLSCAGGDDRLDGGAGADTMVGGLGDDTYVVDTAGDVVTEVAGEGTDTVEAWLGWTLGADLERLRLLGTADLNGTGNGLNNTLYGNAGKNLLDGKAGADTMAGGQGDDTYIVEDPGDQTIEVRDAGVDLVRSSITWALAAYVENLTLTGIASINGTGNGSNNVLTGNGGKNVLDGKAGADTMAGGLGDDTYIVDAAGDVAVEEANAGTDTVQSSVTWQLRTNFERLVLTGSANVNGTGNELANVLTGNAGNNVLDGGAGIDTMAGGLGNDTYVIDHAGDRANEDAGGGTDTVLSSLSHTLRANLENLVLTGTAAINGSGNGEANSLTGNGAANVLDGKAGADRMEGRAGDDTYVIDNAGDVVIEAAGGGTDGAQSSVDYKLAASVETLTLTGTANLNGTGNGLANILVGNGGDNRLDGGAGADTMTGGLGNDIYVIDNAGDVVTEKAGGGIDTVLSSITHTLHANVENLVLTGTAARSGTGNAGANALTGNGGRNVLDGGLGADVLAGGGGGDTFRFSTALGADNVDRIVLFDHTGDTIQLDDGVFAALGMGGLAAGVFNLGTVASQADDRILFDSASKSLYYDADGLGAAAAVRFATIDTLQGVLDHTDFLIV